MTQQELQRQYQRNLSEAQLAEHQQARIALENSASFARSHHHYQDVKQIPSGIVNGHAPSIITSHANNDSFYHQRATTIHSTIDTKATRQNYRWIDGRRHHNTDGAAYIMPNDIDEMDRFTKMSLTSDVAPEHGS
ncbi:hypothetical protein KI688_002757 [Linnemannia hyalina]|uniref:Uncharacterized protein n=1 Tax=Linnemannia hyalina TaxID=64524 RepID=A0A9P7XQW6_9FUNG|nr:hypothetical protein KI688_002757 [Linnemannia hyalina]